MTELPPGIAELLTAWHARDWYALAVLLVLFLTKIFRESELWFRIPRWAEPFVPMLLGAVCGLADAYYSGAPPQIAFVQAIAAGLQIGLGAVGVHHASKRWGGGSGFSGPLILLLGFGATSCGLIAPESPTPERCSPEALAAIEGEYVATVLWECRDYAIPEECPKYPELKEHFKTRREEWIECQ